MGAPRISTISNIQDATTFAFQGARAKEEESLRAFKSAQTQIEAMANAKKKQPGFQAQTLLTTGSPGRNSLLTMKAGQ